MGGRVTGVLSPSCMRKRRQKPANRIQKAAATSPNSVTPHDLFLFTSSSLTVTMLFQASSFLALVAAVVAQSLVINTPASVVQCQPAQVTWTATNTPVFVSIIPGGQPGAAALQDFGQQTGQSLTWTVNIAAGTSITFQLRDSTGAVAYSSPISVQASSDSSCLGAQASTSAPATSAVASTSAAATSTPAATSAVASVSSVISSAASSVSSVVSTATAPATTSRAVTSSAASVISSATSRASTASSAAASPSSTNAAMPTAKVGLAGLLGLAAAVVMA